MVSKIANRNKLVGSRRRHRGAGQEVVAETESIQRLNAEAKEEGGLKKKSDQLRLAAIEQLKALKAYGQSDAFAINIDKSTERDEQGNSVNKLEDQFYKRCDASRKLVSEMSTNLEAEREANLLALIEAETKLQKQKQSAVKSQAAWNFLKKKHENFEKLNTDLDALKLEIAKLVSSANTLNESCTTELDDTVNKDLKETIKDQIASMEEKEDAIRGRLEKLLDEIDGKTKSEEAVPVDAAAANATAEPKAVVTGPAKDADEADAAKGGRYRRSRNNNLRKRRSFLLKGGCEGYSQKECDKAYSCMWEARKKKCSSTR